MYKSRLSIKQLLNYLNDIIDSSSYFISGSYANPSIKEFNDIDLFFYSEKEYKTAIKKFKVGTKFGTESKHSTTLSLSINNEFHTVQLIKKQFGSPEEIFKSFDLNICKHAILGTGKLVSHLTAAASICISNLDSATFKRVLKYMTYYSKGWSSNPYDWDYSTKDITYLCHLVDTYINDSQLLPNYYEEVIPQEPANTILFREFSNVPQIKGYLDKKALQHAPELLL